MWPYSVCCRRPYHLIPGCIFSLCSLGGVLRDQPGLLRQLGMYGGHAGQQRRHQSGQVRCSRTKRSSSPLTHLPTQSVICLSEPAQRLWFFSLGGIEHDCVYITLLALREIKAVMWLCLDKKKTKSYPISTLVGNLCDNVKKKGFNIFNPVASSTVFMCLWALF